MLKKRLLIPLTVILSLLLLYGLDRAYYGDKVRFLCPVQIEGEKLPIRYDSIGDGRFGAKRKNGKRHKGVDISAPLGTPVRAAKSGWAIAREDRYGYGNYVRIVHPAGLTTIYAHLDEVKVIWIKRVRQGEVIGTVGKSGNAGHRLVKPHLHFEILKKNEPCNPIKELLK